MLAGLGARGCLKRLQKWGLDKTGEGGQRLEGGVSLDLLRPTLLKQETDPGDSEGTAKVKYQFLKHSVFSARYSL